MPKAKVTKVKEALDDHETSIARIISEGELGDERAKALAERYLTLPEGEQQTIEGEAER